MKNKQQYISVLLPMPFKGAFDYLDQDIGSVQVGSFVRVPFGRSVQEGVVLEIHDRDPAVSHDKLKEIQEVIQLPELSKETLHFIQRMSHYTLNPLGSVLKLFMSVPQVFDPPKMRRYYRFVPLDRENLKLTPLQQKVCDAFEGDDVLTREDILGRIKVSAAVLKALVEKRVLVPQERKIINPEREYAYSYNAPTLSKDQEMLARALKDTVSRKEYSVSVIDGVTGSGKTEVYFEAIAEALKKPGQILVLLPEIVLSPQWLERFECRFGAKPIVWHSDVGEKERRQAWYDIIHGRARVVVGARSALFLPYQKLSLIIVDEEHDSSYKQEEGLIYQGRDMAVLRAHISHVPIILASATPSLETIENCRRGRYQYFPLTSRHGDAVMPSVTLIPMQDKTEKGKKRYWISEPLAQLIEETAERQEQVLLYLNRRGYAPVTLCRDCGKRIECPRCTAALVEHKVHEDLRCHHCGYAQSFHTQCLSCGAEASFVSCGPGVERVAEEVRVRFPHLRTLVIASDHVQTKESLGRFLNQIQNNEVDLIVGTQIMAKGHHFPNLTLVGVIDADLGLSGADPRASERTFQTLHQVAGRAGRSKKAGKVYIQTYFPDHPVLQALRETNKDAFVEQELLQRAEALLPPYGRLIAFIFKGVKETAVETAAKRFATRFPPSDHYRFLGPIQAPIYRIRGQYRWRALLQSSREIPLQKVVQQVLSEFTLDSSVRLHIDVDPYSFL